MLKRGKVSSAQSHHAQQKDDYNGVHGCRSHAAAQTTQLYSHNISRYNISRYKRLAHLEVLAVRPEQMESCRGRQRHSG